LPTDFDIKPQSCSHPHTLSSEHSLSECDCCFATQVSLAAGSEAILICLVPQLSRTAEPEQRRRERRSQRTKCSLSCSPSFPFAEAASLYSSSSPRSCTACFEHLFSAALYFLVKALILCSASLVPPSQWGSSKFEGFTWHRSERRRL
jgi:hypothetical protein